MMKKLLAVVLALTLTLGMTTVAFAASKTEDIKIDDSTVYTYDSDSKTMEIAKKYEPGKTYYIPVWDQDDNYNGTNRNITSTSALSNYKLRRSIDEGAKIISGVDFVIKNVDKFDTASNNNNVSNNKAAFISITTKDVYSSDDIDVEMEIYVYGNSTYRVNGKDSETINFDKPFEYGSKDATNYISVSNSTPIVNFDDIDSDEIEIGFNEAKDDVRFVVNAKGQKELFLRYSNDDGSSIAAPIVDKYPEAALDFHLFEGNNKTFRRTGKLYIPASEIEVKDGKMGAPYLYEIVNGKLTEIKATYDSNAEEFVISTNKLGNYVVSDTKLKSTTEKDESSSKDETSSTTETTTTKPGTSTGNPDTGANDVVGVAVALAVVSLAAIGATSSFKKRTK
ncbi:hypothetical protein EDD70_2382 [Hydrogenoanaerobacterium saccharovorans]|uniref:LPXTG-motif cell wall anchor domain-containing protein n=1 Tax=Hydrogenoanaerobacterium saccharovorans TaxID=474960 RepID=A0A1H8D1Z2_9FIRM|nr:hypothetical protein [Hydrogenoanaerobacterium saccharovorans]RPF43417.1 hypothetical protein EDD70_2382 [Hydrogenoanaerobacterium saccharovorans]SEN00714.1 hypothetical protein SAMN05216180_2441 [Hydrogenoanaerobacterium saccharovorans]